MTIKAAGTSGTYSGLPGGTISLGPKNTVTPALPNDNYDFAFDFEIVATLTPGSDASQCGEGQQVRWTERYDFADWPKAGCPYEGSSYCDDGYHSSGLFKVHDGTTIRWFDGPGWEIWDGTSLSKSTILDSDYLWSKGAFIAQVTGTSGKKSCSCTWKYKANVSGRWGDEGKGVTITQPTIYDISCTGVVGLVGGGSGCGGRVFGPPTLC